MATTKALTYAVLRLAAALPDTGADSRDALADVRRALGVADADDHAAQTSADVLDNLAGPLPDDTNDDDPDDDTTPGGE